MMYSRIIPIFLIAGLLALSACAEKGDRTGVDPGSGGGTRSEPAAPPPGYGAIAFSPTTQRWHVRSRVAEPARARTLAIQYCAAADCRVVLTFGPKQCGTFSLGDRGALGVGAAPTRSAASEKALGRCAASGQRCKVAKTWCNSREADSN